MSAKACLPSTGGSCKTGKSDITPGWSDYVKPYSEDSKFWYSTWLSAGKPDQGPLHETMKKSKCQYKYAVRRLKRANESIQNDKFVSGVIGGGLNIFTEIKKFRGKTKNSSSRIDEHVGAKNIANHFADIYSELYSRHSHGAKFDSMVSEINSKVGNHSIGDHNKITVNVVKKALKLMKSGKNDAIFDFQSDCLSCGSEELIIHLMWKHSRVEP